MRFSKYVFFLSVFAILLPLSAMAGVNNERKVLLSSAVEVGTTQLQPGTYKIEWVGNGPAVNVQFIKNGKTVATTQGHWVSKPQPAAHDSVTTEKASNNRHRLVEIDFHNQKEVLQINGGNNPSGI